MNRQPLTIEAINALLEQGYNAGQVADKLGYAKRTVYEFLQKSRRGIPGDMNATSTGHFPDKGSVQIVRNVRAETPHKSLDVRRTGNEAEYYLRRRIQDLEGVLDTQKDEISDLKEDNRELTRERNKLSRDLELAEERKQLDLQKLTLEHSAKAKNSLSGFMDAVSTNEKLGEVMVMVAQRVLGAPALDKSTQTANENIFSSAAANIISGCDEQKQAMLATVVEALASPDNEQTLKELFALATGQQTQNNGH